MTAPASAGEPTRTAGRPLRIGITGPIGCGKSTVAGWLGELGATVIDADRVARDVTPPGSPELAAIVDDFGAGILQADGSLDRPALGRIVFADAVALRRLESIVHPAVRPRILALMALAEGAGAPAVVVEAIKLVEGGLAELCDEVWLITCTPEVQRARLSARDAARSDSRVDASAGSAARAADTEARIAAQSDLVARLTPSATRILDTSGSIAESHARVRDAWESAVAAKVAPPATN